MHSAPDLPGLLPTNLNLAPDTAASIYSWPRLETAHRTSLMSTGSSDSGTGSTSDQDQPLLSPASGQFSTRPSPASTLEPRGSGLASHNCRTCLSLPASPSFL